MPELRSFAAFVMGEVEKKATSTQKQVALDKVNARRLIDALKSEIECFALAGLFEGGFTQTQNLIESYLSRLKGSSKINDFAVCNATKPHDLEDGIYRLDIMIKPKLAEDFIYMQSSVTRSGLLI